MISFDAFIGSNTSFLKTPSRIIAHNLYLITNSVWDLGGKLKWAKLGCMPGGSLTEKGKTWLPAVKLSF